MRRRGRGLRRGAWLTLGILGCATAGPAPPDLPAPTPAPDRVLLISVSGLDADALEGGRSSPPLPTLSALAASGAYAERVIGVAPASAYPAHASLLTGVLPASHGVVADRRLGDRGVRRAPYAHAGHLRAATLWQRVGERGGSVASLDWPSTRGAAIAWVLPDGAPAAGATWVDQILDAATPALRAFVESHGGTAPAASVPGPERDVVLGELACELLTGAGPPDLLLLRLSGAAAALARSGPGTPEVAAAFGEVDRRIADLLDCLAGAGRLASSLIAVVGDHGVAPAHTAIAANVALVGEGLIAADAAGIASWRAIARANGGTAFVYARDEAAAVRARIVLQAAAEETRAFRVVSAEEMIRHGADPEAWFGLEAEPGFVFGEAASGDLLQASQRRGVGGYLPDRPEMDTALVLWGGPVRAGVRIPRMHQTDVAPTLAQVLDVKLDRGEGRALVGVLASGRGSAVSAEGARP